MRTKNRKFIATGWSCALICVLFIFASLHSEGSISETELQISNIEGGIGSVIVEVTNIGDVSADSLVILTYVTGGLFGNIDLSHQCAGCDMCGTTLEPGMTKTESTREAGLLFGFGPITVTVIATALNADEVSLSMSGFILGPFVIV